MTLLADALWNSIGSVLLTLRADEIPLLFSAWISVVFAERIVVDKMAWGTKRFRDAFVDTGVVVIFLSTWMLILWSLLLKEESITTLRYNVVRWLGEYLIDAKAILIALVIWLSIAIYSGIKSDSSILHVIVSWWKSIYDYLRPEIRITILGVLYLGLTYFLLAFFGRFLEFKTAALNTQLKNWTVGNFPIAIVWVIYVLIYYQSFYHRVIKSSDNEKTKDAFRTGFLKDSFVYCFMAACLVSGMYRFGQCIPYLHGIWKWYAYAIFCGFAIMLAVVAIVMELLYKNKIIEGKPTGYPKGTHKALVLGHVYLRMFLILTLVIAVFVWLLRRIAMVGEPIPN